VKYMLMMNAKRGKGDWEVIAWPPEDLKAHIGFVKRFNKELRDAGELVAAEGLAAPGQARVVGARKDGTPEVTDGPFQKPRNFSRAVRAHLLGMVGNYEAAIAHCRVASRARRAFPNVTTSRPRRRGYRLSGSNQRDASAYRLMGHA